MATITGIKKEKVLEVIRRYKMAVAFDVLQFGDVFSIQMNGKEVIGFTEEDIIYLHDKYRQAYRKPCVEDLERKIDELNNDYIEVDESCNTMYLDNKELRDKIVFLSGELSGANEEIRILQDAKIALLNDNERLTKELFKVKQEIKYVHEENWRMLHSGVIKLWIKN